MYSFQKAPALTEFCIQSADPFCDGRDPCDHAAERRANKDRYNDPENSFCKKSERFAETEQQTEQCQHDRCNYGDNVQSLHSFPPNSAPGAGMQYKRYCPYLRFLNDISESVKIFASEFRLAGQVYTEFAYHGNIVFGQDTGSVRVTPAQFHKHVHRFFRNRVGRRADGKRRQDISQCKFHFIFPQHFFFS